MSETVGKPHFTTRGGKTVVEYRVPSVKAASGLALLPATNYQSYLGLVRESYAGAWQSNVTALNTQSLLTFSAIYACISLIAGDISKLGLLLTQDKDDGTWLAVPSSSPFWIPLRKPNNYQTSVQFISAWIVSKLIYGNTFVLKERDQRGVVTDLHVLDPLRVMPLVATSGDVYYRIALNYLARVDGEGLEVPATEIIHDRALCIWHPLIGISPIYACSMTAAQGVAIQTNSNKFFTNMSRPSGVLTAPGKIGDDTADRIKKTWESGFQGSNIGRLAVLGDGLTYQAMTIPANEAQLIEQLNWTVADVARAFHVPPYKLGMETKVNFNHAAQLDQDYYKQCLQTHIEALEVALGEGLELPVGYRVECDLDGLLRMDPQAQAETNASRIQAGELAPNEARRKNNLPPVAGGESPYLQQQNYSLAALAKRDAKPDPFAGAKPPAPADPTPPSAPAPSPKEYAEAVMQHVAPAISSAFESARAEVQRKAELEREENESSATSLADALIKRLAA